MYRYHKLCKAVCTLVSYFLVTSHINCVVAHWPVIVSISLHVSLTGQQHVKNDVAIFEWRPWRWINTEIDNYVIIASLKSEPTYKLINRKLGLHILISSLPGSAVRTYVESLSKPCDSTSVIKALLGKLDIKRHSSSILYIHRPLVKSAYQKNNFLISQPKHMLWVLKRTISMRRFFWAPKTYAKNYG